MAVKLDRWEGAKERSRDDAFAELYESSYPSLVKYCRGLLGDGANEDALARKEGPWWPEPGGVVSGHMRHVSWIMVADVTPAASDIRQPPSDLRRRPGGGSEAARGSRTRLCVGLSEIGGKDGLRCHRRSARREPAHAQRAYHVQLRAVGGDAHAGAFEYLPKS